jgi:DNA-binding transcriptional LysR family regulator
MELRQLRYFAAVARHGHFGRAAEELYVTQSALSQQIARLEEELGLALALRTSRGVELTPAGAELWEHAEEILGRVEHARAAIDGHAGAVRGAARLASNAHDAGALAGAVAAFHVAHPGVRLSVRLLAPNEACALAASGSVDAAVVGIHADVPPPAPGLLAELLREEELMVAGAPGSAFAGADAVSIEALRGAPLVLPARGAAVRAAVDERCQRAGFSPLPVVETDDPRMIRALAGRGLGLTVAPRPWLEGPGPELATARLAPERGEDRAVHRLMLLRLADERLTPVGRLLVEHLHAGLGERAGAGEGQSRASPPGGSGAGQAGAGGQHGGRSSIGGRSA